MEPDVEFMRQGSDILHFSVFRKEGDEYALG